MHATYITTNILPVSWSLSQAIYLTSVVRSYPSSRRLLYNATSAAVNSGVTSESLDFSVAISKVLTFMAN